MFSEAAQEPDGGGSTSHYVQHWVLGPKKQRIMALLPILHQPPLFLLSVLLLPIHLLPLFLIVSERWKSSENSSPLLIFLLFLI